MKHVLFASCLSAALALPAFAEFSPAAKDAVRAAATEAATRLRAATQLTGKSVTLLPVRGDDGGYVERLLIDAGVNAGKTIVISNDDKTDERFRRILKEIAWDELQTTLKSIDSKTVDELGHLKSTQVLMEASVKVTPRKNGRKAEAELNLLAYEITTKQYIWSTVIVPAKDSDSEASVEVVAPEEVKVPLTIAIAEVKTDGSEGTSALMGIQLRDELAKLGHKVVQAPDRADITITMDTMASLFDQTGEWYVLEGTVNLRADLTGAEKKPLADTVLSAKGKRGLGSVAAHKNLAKEFAPQISGWIKKTLAADAVSYEAVTFALKLGDSVEASADLEAYEAVRKAAEVMDGVRSATLAKQDNKKGVFAYRVVYEKKAYPGGFLNALRLKNVKLFKPFED